MATSLNDVTTATTLSYSLFSILSEGAVTTNNLKNLSQSWEEKVRVFWEIFGTYQTIAGLTIIICVPIVLILGIFGNVMIVVIMFRLPKASLGVWFHCLAWFDQLVLVSNALPEWLFQAFGVPFLETLGSWACKIDRVLTYAVPVLSSWTLVALTFQRAASVVWPHRISAGWTQKQSGIAVTILIALVTLLHLHFFYGVDYDREICARTVTKCCIEAVSDDYAWFFSTIWAWWAMVQFSFLPFALLVIGNSVLVWTTVKSATSGGSLTIQPRAHDSRQKKVSSLTVTLVTVSASFLIFSIPISVTFIWYRYIINSMDPVVLGQFVVFSSASYVLQYVNSGINFYLYCLTGTKFRAECTNIVGFVFRFRCKEPIEKSGPRSSKSKAVMTATNVSASSSIMGTNDKNNDF